MKTKQTHKWRNLLSAIQWLMDVYQVLWFDCTSPHAFIKGEMSDLCGFLPSSGLLTNIGVAESLLRMHRRTAARFSDFLHSPQNKHNQRAKEAVHCVRHFPPGELILQVIKVRKPTDFLYVDLVNRFADPPWQCKSWHCPLNDNNTLPIVFTQYYAQWTVSFGSKKNMRVMLTFADNLCYFTLICTRALYLDCLVWVCFCLTLSGSFLKAARTGLLPPIQKRPAVGDSAVKVLPLCRRVIFCLSRCVSQLMSYQCGHWLQAICGGIKRSNKGQKIDRSKKALTFAALRGMEVYFGL